MVALETREKPELSDLSKLRNLLSGEYLSSYLLDGGGDSTFGSDTRTFYRVFPKNADSRIGSVAEVVVADEEYGVNLAVEGKYLHVCVRYDLKNPEEIGEAIKLRTILQENELPFVESPSPEELKEKREELSLSIKSIDDILR